jgi:CHAT domain-containing protein
MRGRLLAGLLFMSGCSRSPAPGDVYQKALAALQEGRLEQAYQLTSKALESDKRSDFDSERLELLHGEVLLAKGLAKDALPRLEVAGRDPRLKMRRTVDRAEALNKLGRTNEASNLLDEVDRTFPNTPEQQIDRDARFKALMLRFVISSKSSNFEESAALLQKGRKLAEEDGSAFEQAAVLLNLSFGSLKRGRFDEALQYSRPSLDAAEKAKAGQIVAMARNNLGISYRGLGDLDLAEEHQNKAIEQLRQMGDLLNLQDALGALGNIDLERHQPEQAIKDFQQAYEISKSIDATIPAGRWAGQIATALVEKQQWSDADTWNRRAYELYSRVDRPENALFLKLNEGSIANGKGNPAEATRLFKEAVEQSKGEDAYVEWSGHVRLARLLAHENRITEADDEYERGLDVLDKRGASFGIAYRDRRIEFFKDYVDLLVSQHKEDRALQVVEFSRARTLAEKLGLQSQAIGRVDLNKLKQYARQSGSVMLSYWLAPRRSFVWIVRPDLIQMKELPGVEDLEPAIRAYRKVIEEDARDPVALGLTQGKQLSDVLLGPVIPEISSAKRIVVVPDGALHGLNLETLPIPGVERYWIEDAEISITPSLSVLARTVPHRIGSSLLLVGAPVAVSPEFPALPGAAAEIEAIRTRFVKNNTVVRTGESATPASFFSAMPGNFSMIHFAAHAEANPKNPLESAVILSRDGDRYKLYAHEIANMKLSADLVTLSACHSAGARAYGGEGLVGFAWAFLQSGAHSVIAGLWDISDSSSLRLMDLLYQDLAAGTPPATALRQAKLALLRSGSYRKPFYWAPFQIFVR